MKVQSPNHWTPREYHAISAETQTSPAPREGISGKFHHGGTIATPLQPVWISSGAGALPGPSISALGKCPCLTSAPPIFISPLLLPSLSSVAPVPCCD